MAENKSPNWVVVWIDEDGNCQFAELEGRYEVIEFIRNLLLLGNIDKNKVNCFPPQSNIPIEELFNFPQ